MQALFSRKAVARPNRFNATFTAYSDPNEAFLLMCEVRLCGSAVFIPDNTCKGFVASVGRVPYRLTVF